MENNIAKLVTKLEDNPLGFEAIDEISSIFDQLTDEKFFELISSASSSLVILEQWTWELLRGDPDQWLDRFDCSRFFSQFSSINKKIIFIQDLIEVEAKMKILLPSNIDVINDIFHQIEQRTEDQDPYLTYTGLWFDNLSFFLHEYPQMGKSALYVHLNGYFGKHFLMTDLFHHSLIQLQQTELPPNMFTAKWLFYLKTCSLSLNAYFYSNPQEFPLPTDEILHFIGSSFLQAIQIQSTTIEHWTPVLLSCLAHLIGFVRAFTWWEGEQGIKLKVLFPDEQSLCQYSEALIRIIDYKPFHQHLIAQWFNSETILLDSALLFLMNIVQTQNINWFFQSMTNLPDKLLAIAQDSVYFRIYICAYGILSEILNDENLKELKINAGIGLFFFHMLEQALQHPSKRYKQIPISYLLRGFLNLSKNDFIQQGTALSNKLPLFLEMTDQFPIAYDIVWALSFNPEIQQQILSNSAFISKLANVAKESDDEQMRKTANGILWNLDSQHNRPTQDLNDHTTFDIMISYSHKDKVLCKQLYEQLIKAGYRVWIDFEQMHGNVMDAMAQAIERSQTIIICMSEQYRRSNYCRAEAQYAFQRQLKMVPVLLQKHYKPDGWLLFLVGQLLYVDFTKHEFDRAMKMVLKEIKATRHHEPDQPKVETLSPVISSSCPEINTAIVATRSIFEWNESEVEQWLVKHELQKMCRLLNKCDGRSLLYLHRYLRQDQGQEMIRLLEGDSKRLTNESLSLVELCRFQSLIDRERQMTIGATSSSSKINKQKNPEKKLS